MVQGGEAVESAPEGERMNLVAFLPEYQCGQCGIGFGKEIRLLKALAELSS